MLSGVSKLAKLLASHELKTRKLGYRYVRELLSLKPGTDEFDISYKDILGICKGLYYSLWAQDKLLLQEEAASRIVKLVITTKCRKIRSMYIRGMFETLAYEWDNLDVWRQDKFMMLTRDLFVRCLISVRKRAIALKAFEDAVFEQILNKNSGSAVDLKLHLCLVIEQELPKAGEIPRIVHSFFKHTVDTLQAIPKRNVYGSTLKKLLFYLTKEIRKYPDLPLIRLSEELLDLSTKNTVHRKALRRIARMLHSKNLTLKYVSNSTTDESATATTAEISPIAIPAIISKRKRKLEKSVADSSLDVKVPSSKRRKISTCNGVCENGEPSSLIEHKTGSQTTKVIDGDIEKVISEPEPPTVTEINPNFDLSVLDQPSTVPLKKRVSFGKVFRKKYSSKNKVAFKPPKLTKPDRGILRR